MSSTSALPLVTSCPDPLRLASDGFEKNTRQYTEHTHSWQSLVGKGRPGSYFASGLPTPPETRVMTGIGLNQHNSSDVVPQSYFPSKSSYPGYFSARGQESLHHQHNLDSYNHNNVPTYSSRGNQSQSWSANHERENRNTLKDSSKSDSTIATYLQIPSSINDSKGSLAEFAAEVGQPDHVHSSSFSNFLQDNMSFLV